MMDLANKRLLALITGATGSFGSCLAKELTRVAINVKAASLTLILHGRRASTKRLKELSDELQALPRAHRISLRQVHLPLDLESRDVASQTGSILRKEAKGLHHAILFNNAGVLKAASVRDSHFAHTISQALRVHVLAPAEITQSFLSVLPTGVSRRVVHTSSLAAIQPFRAWGAYCVSKAAGDMLHAVVAAESCDVRVLCYAPGPMRTAMTRPILRDVHGDPAVKRIYASLERKDAFVNPSASSRKLIQLLMDDTYANGEHIDFYDT